MSDVISISIEIFITNYRVENNILYNEYSPILHYMATRYFHHTWTGIARNYGLILKLSLMKFKGTIYDGRDNIDETCQVLAENVASQGTIVNIFIIRTSILENCGDNFGRYMTVVRSIC
jgi:hypothetical protein